ncbi:hypothetical protein GCM10027347_16270 [Larkinella harenae]
MSMLQLRARMNLLFASGPDFLDVELAVQTGRLLGLYGPSGSGKTTLLRILAGLTLPEQGVIRLGEQIWLDTERHINLPVQQRVVGMVFQDAALFPNMTVRQNIQYAAEKRDTIVDELLELVGLTKLADRHPATLSGGQRQRVALIRALARRPHLLLLDEPFSALDPETRAQLLTELVRLHQRFGTTTVLVSHQQEDIQRVADELLEIRQGKAFSVEKKAAVSSALGVGVSGRVTYIDPEPTPSYVQIQIDETIVSIPVTPDAIPWRIGDTVTVPIDSTKIVAKQSE